MASHTAEYLVINSLPVQITVHATDKIINGHRKLSGKNVTPPRQINPSKKAITESQETVSILLSYNLPILDAPNPWQVL